MHIRIMTPHGTYLDKEISSLHVTTNDGERTILSNHAPLLASLQVCPLILRVEEQEQEYALAGGFLQVQGNEVTILTDAIEGADEIDVSRAQAALKRAQERLEKKDTVTNMKRSELALSRAINRIHVSQKH